MVYQKLKINVRQCLVVCFGGAVMQQAAFSAETRYRRIINSNDISAINCTFRTVLSRLLLSFFEPGQQFNLGPVQVHR